MHHVTVLPEHGSVLPEHPALPGAEVDPSNVADLGLPEVAPIGGVGIGVVAPYDFALDRELWRWVPEDVALLTTRTPYSPLSVSIDQALTVSDNDAVAACTRSLITTQPEVVTYLCTSGSFVNGIAGERELVAAMRAAGSPAAMTTSGAMLMALRHLGLTRIAIATPYDTQITQLLVDYLSEAGVGVTASTFLGLDDLIWRVPYASTVQLVRDAVRRGPDCEAVFISCTNVPTYDLIAPLERELGMPVLTANQVSMWAALHLAGIAAVGDGQGLLGHNQVDAA